ncbi:hypothetical protein O181_107182 [Austropuccinia psidii MF-1]|uniref:Uncharacterized protein n=1 Tax=Austropuccinia psidii MF-1 TaxID=1389203 RepID=A0A9Q3JTG8_9BASI|nr:hypothetical protein [Austropuccinia psidii MF-1]
MLAQRRSTNGVCIESPEVDITVITVVGPAQFPTGSKKDIPLSVEELVHGRKTTGVGTSSKSLDRHTEFLSLSEEVDGPRKDRGHS